MSLLTIGGVNIAAALFSDVTSSHANYDAIKYVESEGIVSGYEG